MGWFTVITSLLNFPRTKDLYITSPNIGMFIFCGSHCSRSWENMNLLIVIALMWWFDHICYFWVQRSDLRKKVSDFFFPPWSGLWFPLQAQACRRGWIYLEGLFQKPLQSWEVEIPFFKKWHFNCMYCWRFAEVGWFNFPRESISGKADTVSSWQRAPFLFLWGAVLTLRQQLLPEKTSQANASCFIFPH